MSLSLHLFAIEKKVPEFILKLNKNNIIFSNKNYELSVQYRWIKKIQFQKQHIHTPFFFSLLFSFTCWILQILRIARHFFNIFSTIFSTPTFVHTFFDFFRFYFDFISIFHLFCLLNVLSIHVNLLKKSELYKLPEPKKELFFFFMINFPSES
jgi:hypothetical protein